MQELPQRYGNRQGLRITPLTRIASGNLNSIASLQPTMYSSIAITAGASFDFKDAALLVSYGIWVHTSRWDSYVPSNHNHGSDVVEGRAHNTTLIRPRYTFALLSALASPLVLPLLYHTRCIFIKSDRYYCLRRLI